MILNLRKNLFTRLINRIILKVIISLRIYLNGTYNIKLFVSYLSNNVEKSLDHDLIELREFLRIKNLRILFF